MRIVTTIPHPLVKISVFAMNNKYLLKMEANGYEQVYKIPEDEVDGLGKIENILTEEFMNSVVERFKSMMTDWNSALNNRKI
jgi:hypothetical protein